MKRVRGIITCLITAACLVTPVQAGEAEHIAVEAMREVWNIEEGGLAEGATKAKLQTAVEAARDVTDKDVKKDLYIMAYAAEREFEKPIEPILAEPEKKLYGTCTVTHYCNCSKCCGQWAGGNTASGAYPTAGWTVAMDLPFGTKVQIGDHVYCVEDRGVTGMHVDIYVDSHDEALRLGMYEAEVYIVA